MLDDMIERLPEGAMKDALSAEGDESGACAWINADEDERAEIEAHYARRAERQIRNEFNRRSVRTPTAAELESWFAGAVL